MGECLRRRQACRPWRGKGDALPRIASLPEEMTMEEAERLVAERGKSQLTRRATHSCSYSATAYPLQ